MENALEIKGLCKSYKGFALENVNMVLPRGCVMGFVGENGAGKTTTIKAVLNLIRRDAGEIRALGLDNLKNEKELKERIGVVLEDGSFLNTMDAKNIDSLLKKAYPKWDSEKFMEYMRLFGIEKHKTVKEYSKGMRMKTAIATALSHDAELLILDEPTSGLDPVVRDEVLDMLYEFMQDENHAILISSHITSDLDKIADYIAFIHEGKIIFCEERDAILDTYGLLRCTKEQFASLEPGTVKAKRTGTFGCEALVRREGVPGNLNVERVNIEQIMLLMTKGEVMK